MEDQTTPVIKCRNCERLIVSVSHLAFVIIYTRISGFWRKHVTKGRSTWRKSFVRTLLDLAVIWPVDFARLPVWRGSRDFLIEAVSRIIRLYHRRTFAMKLLATYSNKTRGKIERSNIFYVIFFLFSFLSCKRFANCWRRFLKTWKIPRNLLDYRGST